MNDANQLLESIQNGNPEAAEKLLPIVYEELRRLAGAQMARERPDHTLSATGLVHEAFLRLVDVSHHQKFHSRGHFFAAAAQAMRRILVERARARKSLRRGGDCHRVEFIVDQAVDNGLDRELLQVHEALEELACKQPQMARLVELKYFAGLTLEEAAGTLHISIRTAHRRWAEAKAWLREAIGDS